MQHTQSTKAGPCTGGPWLEWPDQAMAEDLARNLGRGQESTLAQAGQSWPTLAVASLGPSQWAAQFMARRAPRAAITGARGGLPGSCGMHSSWHLQSLTKEP